MAKIKIYSLVILNIIFLTSCKFDYHIKINDDNTCVLIQKLTFNLVELESFLKDFENLPYNIKAKKEFYQANGIDIISWPDLTEKSDEYIFEIHQYFKDINEMITSHNGYYNREIYKVFNFSNYTTNIFSIESNFSYLKLDKKHPLNNKVEYRNSIVELILDFNREINYANGVLFNENKSVRWNFKITNDKFIKISFIKKNIIIDFTIQVLAFLTVYNIAILIILKATNKNI